MSGLYLVRSNRRIDEGAIVVEARPGMSRGTLHRLVPGARGVGEKEIEAHDATAAPEPGGQLHRWEVSDLDAGVYVARIVGEPLRRSRSTSRSPTRSYGATSAATAVGLSAKRGDGAERGQRTHRHAEPHQRPPVGPVTRRRLDLPAGPARAYVWDGSGAWPNRRAGR